MFYQVCCIANKTPILHHQLPIAGCSPTAIQLLDFLKYRPLYRHEVWYHYYQLTLLHDHPFENHMHNVEKQHHHNQEVHGQVADTLTLSYYPEVLLTDKVFHLLEYNLYLLHLQPTITINKCIFNNQITRHCTCQKMYDVAWVSFIKANSCDSENNHFLMHKQVLVAVL